MVCVPHFPFNAIHSVAHSLKLFMHGGTIDKTNIPIPKRQTKTCTMICSHVVIQVERSILKVCCEYIYICKKKKFDYIGNFMEAKP